MPVVIAGMPGITDIPVGCGINPPLKGDDASIGVPTTPPDAKPVGCVRSASYLALL